MRMNNSRKGQSSPQLNSIVLTAFYLTDYLAIRDLIVVEAVNTEQNQLAKQKKQRKKKIKEIQELFIFYYQIKCNNISNDEKKPAEIDLPGWSIHDAMISISFDLSQSLAKDSDGRYTRNQLSEKLRMLITASTLDPTFFWENFRKQNPDCAKTFKELVFQISRVEDQDKLRYFLFRLRSIFDEYRYDLIGQI